MSTSLKNLWTAAGDGDLERVRQLLDNGQSPNEKDDNAYVCSPFRGFLSHCPAE